MIVTPANAQPGLHGLVLGVVEGRDDAPIRGS